VRRSVHAGSSLYRLDAELLERLAPDVILTQELCAVCAVSYEIVARAARRLRGDPRIVSLEPSSLEDVFSTIETVGDLTGTRERADRVIAELRLRTERLAQQVATAYDPPMSAGHWTPELVELAGGEPVLAHPGRNSETLAWDAIAAEDPDAVIVAPCGFDLATTLRACADMAENPAWRGLRAVREGRAYAVDGNAYVNRPGPRLVDSAEIFAQALHSGAGPSAAGAQNGDWCAIAL
jgi:iron complex transport system substrate-binding protein